MKKKIKKQMFRVWIEQVNQTYVDVAAIDADDAEEKGYAKWRRNDAHSWVSCVRKIEDEETCPKR